MSTTISQPSCLCWYEYDERDRRETHPQCPVHSNELIRKRDLLRRNLRAGEGISFANGPFAQYEQERIERGMDLRRRLQEVERQIAEETQR